MSSEERIRRAEEIYNRRKMQNGVRVSTTSVGNSTKDRYRLYKKLILQILICFIIYLIFYLIKNSNYIFSQDFINKTKEFLSYDINFQNAYNTVVEYYNNNLKSFFLPNIEDNKKKNENDNLNELNNEEINNNTNEELFNSVGGIGGGEENNIEVLNENTQLSQMEIDAKEIKENYSFILPLKGTITSRYGPREGSKIVSSNHAGIDIGVNEGTIFIAAMEGEVIVASSEGTYGNHIFIKNGDVTTIYAHCKTLYVNERDKITQGQQLGEVGQTGNATGPHLHFEVRKNDRVVNPEFILSFE